MTTSTTTTVDALLADAVARGVATGVYAMAAGPGGTVYSGGAGTRDGERPWAEDTIAWLASMTKSIVAVAALQLVDQGRIGLDDPVGDALPELAAPQVLDGFDGDRPRLRPASAPVTLRGLLSHSAGVGYPFLSADLVRYHERNAIPSIMECRRSTLVDTPLVADPGSGFGYGMSLDWVGLLVERLGGADLETHLREHVFAPLGMTDTGFRITDRSRLANMTARLPDGLVAVPFEIPQEPEAYSGGAGLYGSPRDYLTFLRMISAGGTLDGVRILSADTVADALRRHTEPIAPMISIDPQISHDVDLLPGTETTWSLLGMRNETATPAGRPVGTLAWAGMANAHYWADADSVAVLVTQILPFGDRPVLDLFGEFERAIRHRAGAPPAPGHATT